MNRLVAALLGVASCMAMTRAGEAQTLPNPGGMAPDTPRMEAADPPSDHLNTQDLLFVRQMAVGGRAEADLGKLAQTKARSKAVQDFGKRMANDHAKANETLLRIGGARRASVPKELDPEHRRVRSELEKTPDAEFDGAYLASQVQDHQKTANLLLWHLSFGQSSALTRYSAEMLPIVMEHLELATEELRRVRDEGARR